MWGACDDGAAAPPVRDRSAGPSARWSCGPPPGALAEQRFDIAERERGPQIPAYGAQNQPGLRLSPLENRRSDCLLHDLFRFPAVVGHSCNTTVSGLSLPSCGRYPFRVFLRQRRDAEDPGRGSPESPRRRPCRIAWAPTGSAARLRAADRRVGLRDAPQFIMACSTVARPTGSSLRSYAHRSPPSRRPDGPRRDRITPRTSYPRASSSAVHCVGSR